MTEDMGKSNGPDPALTEALCLAGAPSHRVAEGGQSGLLLCLTPGPTPSGGHTPELQAGREEPHHPKFSMSAVPAASKVEEGGGGAPSSPVCPYPGPASLWEWVSLHTQGRLHCWHC